MSKVTVLIVDDQRLTRISIKTTLTQDAAKESVTVVGEAEEGREAIAMAEKLKPDVILMDIGMPILDGIRATQQIKKKNPKSKVIILTTHDKEEHILDAFRAGATSYCLKETTTSPETLLHVILATAKGDAWIDPKIAKVVLKTLQIATSVETTPENTFQPTMYSLLTQREIDVLKCIAEGKNNTEIAETLCVSMNTVKTHVRNIFQKLEVEDRTAAALKALRERII